MSQSTICLQQRGISPNFTGTIPPIPLPYLSLPPLSLIIPLSLSLSPPPLSPLSLHLSQSLYPSLSLPPSPSLSSVPQCLSRQLLAARWNFAKLHRDYPSNPSPSPPSPFSLSFSPPLSLSLSLPLSQSLPPSPSLSLVRASVSQSTICLQQRGISPNFKGTIPPIPLPPLPLPLPPLSLYPSLLPSLSLSRPLFQSLPPSLSLSLVRASVSQSTICLQQRGISPNFTGTIPPIPLPPLPLPPSLSIPLSSSLSPPLSPSLNPSLSLPLPPSLSSVPQCLSRQFACSNLEFCQLHRNDPCYPSTPSPPSSLQSPSCSRPLSPSLPFSLSIPPSPSLSLVRPSVSQLIFV